MLENLSREHFKYERFFTKLQIIQRNGSSQRPSLKQRRPIHQSYLEGV